VVNLYRLCDLNKSILQKSFAPSLKLVPSLKLLAARDRRKLCAFVVKEKISVLQNTLFGVLKEEPKKAKFAI
jgi:hypothetical protein